MATAEPPSPLPLPRDGGALLACDPEVVRHLLALVQGWLHRARPDLRHQEVLDLTEGTLAEAWGRLASSGAPEAGEANSPSLEAWTLGIAARRLRDSLEAQGRSGAEALESLSLDYLEAQVEAQTMRQMVLEEGLAALPEDQREHLALRYGSALSVDQVAQRLGRHVAEVAVTELQALRSLGETVRDFLGEFSVEVRRSDDAAEGGAG